VKELILKQCEILNNNILQEFHEIKSSNSITRSMSDKERNDSYIHNVRTVVVGMNPISLGHF